MTTGQASEMRTLKCPLTDEEWDAKSHELARLNLEAEKKVKEVADFKLGVKETVEAMQEELKELRQNARDAAESVRSRQIDRDVFCDWYFDLDKGKAFLVRRDTQDALQARDMVPEERQLAIGQRLQEANLSQLAMWQKQLEEAVKETEPEAAEPESTEE